MRSFEDKYIYILLRGSSRNPSNIQLPLCVRLCKMQIPVGNLLLAAWLLSTASENQPISEITRLPMRQRRPKTFHRCDISSVSIEHFSTSSSLVLFLQILVCLTLDQPAEITYLCSDTITIRSKERDSAVVK